MISFDSKKRSSGTRINCDFQDESGLKIKGSAFDDHAKSLDKQISVGKNYAISKAKVQDLFGNKVKGFHNYELVLYKHSQFELLKDDNDYVAPVDHFRPLSDLDSGNVDVEASINVLAVVKSIGAMQNMEIKNKDGTIRDAAYLEVQLVDRSLQHSQIPITFWGPAAADVRRHPAGSAIKLKGVVVISREGRLSLKATGVTDVEFDPKTDDAQELLSWFGGDDDSKRRRIGE
ncbi:hypothetical protein DAPPUDRAFT_105965 [Daphnia pulex]|uniref:Replication protein A OB domain-containing protein n=1 Tax=Daphnia pulex TaxID=6669 RepID=E9GSC9_DAPPU|nr:hypothetical protein DAPPUDRAFT_105965 [Daphnia pulex]|eukprot:EFX77691.1 hypothetical protein DAPPUDRAFT_105965 [Daphnia pulex]